MDSPGIKQTVCKVFKIFQCGKYLVAYVLNFWKLVQAGFYPISPSGPVVTSFPVDIEIYEDKLGQSGDRILSSHITILNIA